MYNKFNKCNKYNAYVILICRVYFNKNSNMNNLEPSSNDDINITNLTIKPIPIGLPARP